MFSSQNCKNVVSQKYDYIIKRLTYEHIDMGVELSLYGTQ